MDSTRHVLTAHGANGKDYALHITRNIFAVSDPDDPGVEKAAETWIEVRHNGKDYKECLGRIIHKNRHLSLTRSVDEFLSTNMDLDFVSDFWQAAKEIGATHIITVSPVARATDPLYIPLTEEEADRLERSFQVIQGN